MCKAGVFTYTLKRKPKSTQFSCPIFQLSMKLIWIDVFEMRAFPRFEKKVRNQPDPPIWSYSKVNHDFDWLIQSTKGGVGASLHLKRVGINWPHDFNKKSHMFFYWKAILFKAINMDRPNFLTWNSCGSDIPKLRATEPTPELYWYFKNLKKKNHYKNSKSLGQHLFNANSMELFVLVFFLKNAHN